MFFIDVVGFCRRLASRWRPLGQEGLNNYQTVCFLLFLFDYVAACPLAGGRWGKRGLKTISKVCFFMNLLVSVATCPLAGGRRGKSGLKTIKKHVFFLFFLFLSPPALSLAAAGARCAKTQ